MSDMKYRNVGDSGLKVSEISLGSWINCSDTDHMETAVGIIRKAYDLGINFFDTSNAYHDGKAETILGEALSVYDRDSYVLASKVYWPVGDGPNDRGLSRKHIFSQIEKSLKRLNTDHVDIYYCHWFDAGVPFEETLRAMDDLVSRGLALYVGVSNWTAAQIAYGLRVVDRYGLHKIITNQSSYSILDRYLERETIPLSIREGIGQVVYSPLAQGALTGKYSPDDEYPAESRALNPLAGGEISIRDFLTRPILECVKQLGELAEQSGLSLANMALAWVLRSPAVASALTGASTLEQVEMNARASGIKLSGDVLERIDEILDSHSFTLKHNIVPW